MCLVGSHFRENWRSHREQESEEVGGGVERLLGIISAGADGIMVVWLANPAKGHRNMSKFRGP